MGRIEKNAVVKHCVPWVSNPTVTSTECCIQSSVCAGYQYLVFFQPYNCQATLTIGNPLLPWLPLRSNWDSVDNELERSFPLEETYLVFPSLIQSAVINWAVDIAAIQKKFREFLRQSSRPLVNSRICMGPVNRGGLGCLKCHYASDRSWPTGRRHYWTTIVVSLWKTFASYWYSTLNNKLLTIEIIRVSHRPPFSLLYEGYTVLQPFYRDIIENDRKVALYWKTTCLPISYDSRWSATGTTVG